MGNQWVQADPIVRFLAKVEVSPNVFRGTPCLEWTAARTRDGYGRFGMSGGKVALAHRWLYERWVHPIPDGLVIDHLCRRPPCVNPAHLEPVTQGENTARGLAAEWNRSLRAKTHCKNGHPYDEANTRWTNGMRFCRACNRMAKRKRRTA